mgnify:CR=1 FL=1
MQYKKLEQIDQETGSEYLKILKIHLEENGNIQEVAAKMLPSPEHCHLPSEKDQ